MAHLLMTQSTLHGIIISKWESSDNKMMKETIHIYIGTITCMFEPDCIILCKHNVVHHMRNHMYVCLLYLDDMVQSDIFDL